MTELVVLRSKMCSVRVEGEDAVNKAKCVKGYVVKKTLTFSDYVKCLREKCELVRQQNSIWSQEHPYTMRQTMIALSPHDDKRAVLPWCSPSLYFCSSTTKLPSQHRRMSNKASMAKVFNRHESSRRA